MGIYSTKKVVSMHEFFCHTSGASSLFSAFDLELYFILSAEFPFLRQEYCVYYFYLFIFLICISLARPTATSTTKSQAVSKVHISFNPIFNDNFFLSSKLYYALIDTCFMNKLSFYLTLVKQLNVMSPVFLGCRVEKWSLKEDGSLS